MSRIHAWSEFTHTLKYNTKNIPILDGNLKKKAQEHEKKREEAVVETLIILYSMAAKKIIHADSFPIVTAGRAMRQSVKSNNENQAAHYIPGQIKINGKEPSHMLLLDTDKPNLDRILIAARLNGIYGATDDLHRNFNYIDSRLEERGMRDAYGLASSLVIKEGLLRPKTSEIERSVIYDAFCCYKYFLRDPIEEKLNPFQLTYTHIMNKPDTKEKEEKLSILQEETNVAINYKPEKLSISSIKYMEKMMNED